VDVDAVDDPQHDPADARHHGRDAPGKGEHAPDVDPEGERRRLVVRHGAHVDALRGELEKQAEHQQEEAPDDDGRHVDGGHLDDAPLDPEPLRQELRVVVEVSAPHQQHPALEHGGEPHGEHDDLDQRLADQRSQEDPFDDEPQDEGPRQRDDEGERHGELRPGDEGQKQEGPEGKDLAVGEVEHARRFEDHDEAHGGQAVEKSDAHAVEQQLQKEIHAGPLIARRGFSPSFRSSPPGRRGSGPGSSLRVPGGCGTWPR